MPLTQSTRPDNRGLWQRLFPQRYNHTAHYERVLGTSLELQFWCNQAGAGKAAEKAALAEIDRLEAVFNVYSSTSELSRWQETFEEDVPASLDLLQLLGSAWTFMQETGGTFNPATEALTKIWQEASKKGQVPDKATLDVTLASLAEPLWNLDVKQGSVRRLTRLPITLNSIAKGTIIDAAAYSAAQTHGVREVLVNIGGDLTHCGQRPLKVAIADPFNDAENATPADVVLIRNQALATSGNYRRGFQIGDQWFSHVIDPRSGWPVEHAVSASVIGPCAEDADALATAFTVLSPQESLELADEMSDEVGVLVITKDGERACNAYWKEHSVKK